MNKFLVSVAGGCAVLAVFPLLALGADAPAAMSMMKPPPNAVSFMCRNAAANEKPTGTIGSQPVVCKTTGTMMRNGMVMVPSTKSSAADNEWRAWLEQLMQIAPVRSGDG